MSLEASTPLTFDLQQNLLFKLEKFQRRVGARSIIELTRFAISIYGAKELENHYVAHRQISVSLSPELRLLLVRLARRIK